MGFFESEVSPIEIPQRRGEALMKEDEEFQKHKF